MLEAIETVTVIRTDQIDGYAGRCPNCHAITIMVNCSWAECISPYCAYPYSINGVWAYDKATG